MQATTTSTTDDVRTGIPRVREAGIRWEGLPRHWFANLAVGTHINNGFNLLLPAGERFFIRSVAKYLHEIKDPALRAAVKGFSGQEAQHAKAHEEFFDVLASQGYPVAEFLQWYEWLAYKVIEPVAPPKLRLAATVALEHYTAIMAETALGTDLLDHAHPAMAKLLRWHASEELEHKAVAFEVLRKVDPRYSVRMAGMAVATATLAGFWLAAVLTMMKTDWEAGRLDGEIAKWHKVTKERNRSIPRDIFLRGLREYLRPDFHPMDRDNLSLAHDFLTQNGYPA